MSHDTRHQCDAIMEMLPWFVNRSLSREDHARVAAHLRECAACAREAGFLADVMSAMPVPAAAREDSPPFSNLLQRINRRERTLQAWKIAAVMFLLIGGIAAITVPAYLFEPKFHTVTSSVPLPADTVQLDLRLVEHGDVPALSRLLERYDADIVAGPDGNGRFRLEFRLADGEHAGALQQQLRGEPSVASVSRVGDSGASREPQAGGKP